MLYVPGELKGLENTSQAHYPRVFVVRASMLAGASCQLQLRTAWAVPNSHY